MKNFPAPKYTFWTIILSAFGLTIFTSCDQQAYKPKTYKVGDTVQMAAKTPIALTDVTSVTESPYQHVMIYFDAGGKSLNLDGDNKIEFYKSMSDETPAMTYDVKELKDMYITTDCNPLYLNYLNAAPEGNVLFCNKRFEFSQFDYFKLIRPGKRTKEATSYLIAFANPQDKFISLGVSFQ